MLPFAVKSAGFSSSQISMINCRSLDTSDSEFVCLSVM